MPKFKVGDKVKILPRKPEWETQGPHYTDRMRGHSLKVSTVERVHHVHSWITLSTDDGYWWHEDWLEPVKKRKFL